MVNFLEIPKEKILWNNKHFFIIKDEYPVNDGHLLIISNELRKDYFDLNSEEKEDLVYVIDKAKSIICKNYKPDGFNIGMNCGEYAGQTVFHFHCHLIPRYKGDMDNPKGGVRHVIPSKGNYTLK